jgi:hypothetical protein
VLLDDDTNFAPDWNHIMENNTWLVFDCLALNFEDISCAYEFFTLKKSLLKNFIRFSSSNLL